MCLEPSVVYKTHFTGTDLPLQGTLEGATTHEGSINEIGEKQGASQDQLKIENSNGRGCNSMGA